MSVICQNFVQNAWKKDLCSNCFKSVGDHESIDIEQAGNSASSEESNINGKYVTQASNVYAVRNDTPPHTTWKTLISERNNKNSQPFKLENGFQGRLLTINKALNGTDKQSNGDVAKEKAKSQTLNGISIRTRNGDVKKPGVEKPENSQLGKKPDSKLTNGGTVSNGHSIEVKKNSSDNQKHCKATTISPKVANIEENKNSIKTKTVDKKPIQSKFTKSNSEDVLQASPNLHSILKKSTSTPTDSGCQARRNSNVGFKDEEPLVIGYGGRDFSPEELEWEMASSDGEQENNSDSLDETEDDKVFSKMTKENTEFNSDNANLLKKHDSTKVDKDETKKLKQNENPNNKISTQSKEKETQKIGNKFENTSSMNGPSKNNSSTTVTNEKTDGPANVNNSEKTAEAKVKSDDNKNKHAKETLPSDQTKGKSTDSETKDSINVAINGDKKSHEAKTSEAATAKMTEAAAISGVDVKNNPEFINGAAPPSSTVDARNKTGSGKTADAVMFSDGGDGTWQENSTADGNEWQDSDTIPGQILQAINTSLTNRHKMRESPELSESIEEDADLLQENEMNKISLSVGNEVSTVCDEMQDKSRATTNEQNENTLNVEPRESFLHGVSSKPSAIYGPASDLFVSRSNSSSSSSSDEQRKSQISLSINVIVNGEDSQHCNDENYEYGDTENQDSNFPEEKCEAKQSVYLTEIKEKPVIPAKPVKQKSPEKQQQNNASYSSIKQTKNEMSNLTLEKKGEDDTGIMYYSTTPPDRTKMAINLVDPYAESNIYHEVIEKDLKMQDTEQVTKIPARESKLAALAIELEQVRHTNTSTKRQAPAPPKIPDPPLEDPPSCTGRVSPEVTHSFSSFRGESMGFSSASSTTSTSSQDTETGYASWNLHGDHGDHPKNTKSKSSFLLTQYSKCKMLAMGYAEDGAKARKKFSIKKLLKIGKETEAPVTFDPSNPNPKAWKYNDHFERPRAKLEIIHPMDLENKSVTVNPGFESLQTNSLSSFSHNMDDSSFRNSVSSDYGSFYSDTLSPGQDGKHEANYEYIQPRQQSTDDHEESSSKSGTCSSTSPTPSRSSTASQASTVTSGSSKNGSVSHRPPKPPPPPRAHSLLPGNKTTRNSDGTFRISSINGDTSSSDEVTVTVTKPQAPRRQCKSAVIRSEYTNSENQNIAQIPPEDAVCPTDDISVNGKNYNSQDDRTKSISSTEITYEENIEENNEQDPPPLISSMEEGSYDNLQNASTDSKVQTSITIKTGASSQKEKLSKSMLSRNKHPPLTKSPARPPPIYSKPQTVSFPKNVHPWKTLEDSYLALTSSNRELLIKLVNQALKKRKNFASRLNKFQFHWADFEIDTSQPSSVFAFGEKIAYHATMPKYSEYSLTLVISIQQQTYLQENSEMKYPMFGKFTDCIPSELLDSSGDNELESMPATILVLDRSNISTIECFSESLPQSLTEENEKELCFITLQLIQSLKSLQVQGIESIDTNCQNLLLAKTKRDRYHTLVFLYDTYEENDYSSESCKLSLCQYTLMLLFQMLKVQVIDESVPASKFSSDMSRKVFETAFSLLAEEKAVSLSQTKTLFECYLWGVTKVLESLHNSDDCDSILHRWLDIERSNCIRCLVNEEESYDINTQNEYYSQFLIRTNVRNIREVASYL